MRKAAAILLFAISLLWFGCAKGSPEPIWDVSTEPDTEPVDAPWDVTDAWDVTGEEPAFDVPADTDLDGTTDADAPIDIHIDPDVDPDLPEECISGTTSTGGTCNVIDKCGCSVGWCTWDIDTTACTIFETCTTITAGTGTHGSSCDPSVLGDCAPGLDCLSTDGGVTGTCYQWCRTDVDCPTGHSCTVPVEFTLPDPCTVPVSSPYDACSI
jgi:hypothetical protein